MEKFFRRPEGRPYDKRTNKESPARLQTVLITGIISFKISAYHHQFQQTTEHVLKKREAQLCTPN